MSITSILVELDSDASINSTWPSFIQLKTSTWKTEHTTYTDFFQLQTITPVFVHTPLSVNVT